MIPTKGAIIPAAVGVDIGCGMMATQTSLGPRTCRKSAKKLRTAIEKAVPHGRTNQGKSGDRGAWTGCRISVAGYVVRAVEQGL